MQGLCGLRYTTDLSVDTTNTILRIHIDLRYIYGSSKTLRGRGSLVVKVTDSYPACHEFDTSFAEDPPGRRLMHVKSVESSNVLRWCGGVVRRRRGASSDLVT
ncbi:hypothetical protein TNCV_2804651 [Trichonephila clavipes]|nr:hypothetical protein TNCV_2804651 [Trichonephila clavipes]